MDNPISKLVPFIGGQFPSTFNKLLQSIKHYELNDDDELKVELWKAYEFGLKRHEGQKRLSGEPYFEAHCVEVAKILASRNMDVTTIISGMLHDTVEDTKISSDEIKHSFGDQISELVQGLTKISKFSLKINKQKLGENYRKLILASSKDLRVILIKLADRLHNMRTIKFIKDENKRINTSIETLEIFSPLASRNNS